MVEDAAGNGNSAVAGQSTYAPQAPGLTVTGVPAATNAAFTATFTFRQPMDGFDITDIKTTNANVSNFFGFATSYTAKVTPVSDGVFTLSVGGDAARGQNSRQGNTSARAQGIYDTVSPTPQIEMPSAVNGSTQVTIRFSEPIEGFEVGDLTATDASLSNFSGSGAEYTVTASPSAATFSLGVDANVIEDAAGNGNVAGSAQAIYDTTRPTVTITGVPSQTATQPFTVTFTFSEPVSGFCCRRYCGGLAECVGQRVYGQRSNLYRAHHAAARRL